MFSEQAGIVAAWLWALAPLSGWTDALFIWNTSLFALLLAWFLVLFLSLDRDIPTARIIRLGALAGVLVMVEVAALPIVALAIIAAWVWRVVTARRAILFALVVAILPGIWLYRNYAAFHEPVFLRSGLGLQLAEGFYEQSAVPTERGHTIPGRNPVELARYKALGEPAYMRERMAEGVRAVHSRTGWYARRVILRAVAFWVGSPSISSIFWFPNRFLLPKLVLWMVPTFGVVGGLWLLFKRRRREVWFLGLLFLGFPVPYFFTHVEFRYRAPLEPIMLALSAGIFCYVWMTVRGATEEHVRTQTGPQGIATSPRTTFSAADNATFSAAVDSVDGV